MRWALLGLWLGSVGCALPCAQDVDCWDGQVCVDQRCTVAGTVSGGSSGLASSGGTVSSGGSSGVASSSGGSSSLGTSSSGGSSSGVGPCARPVLLALIKSNDGSGAARSEVRRWSLAGGSPTACSTLRGGGQLDPREEALAYFPPATFVTGTQGELRFFNMNTDSLTWEYAQPGGESGLPRSIFSMQGPQGQAAVAAACSLSFNDVDPDFVEVMDPATQQRLGRWELDTTPLQLGISVLTMARHPVIPTSVVYTYATVRDLRAVPLPFDGNTAVFSAYATGSVPTGFAQRMQTYAPQGGSARVLYSYNPGGGTTLGLHVWLDNGNGPLSQPAFTCGLAECASGNVIDAAADPTDSARAFAICQPGSDELTTHLVRAGPGGSCEAVLLDASLPALSHVHRLAVAD